MHQTQYSNNTFGKVLYGGQQLLMLLTNVLGKISILRASLYENEALFLSGSGNCSVDVALLIDWRINVV